MVQLAKRSKRHNEGRPAEIRAHPEYQFLWRCRRAFLFLVRAMRLDDHFVAGFRVFGGTRWLTPAAVKEARTRARAFPGSLVRRSFDGAQDRPFDGAPFDWDKRVID